MKKLSYLLVALALGLSGAAMAEEGGPGKGDKGDRPHPPRDCSKAPDAEKKARCEAREAAMKKCKDLKGEEHHKCMREAMPKPKDK